MDARIIGEFSGSAVVTLGAVGGLGRLLYNKFKKSGFREVEPFARYITRGIKYYVGRYLRHQLAAEFTLRQYARLQLRTVAREMFVPASVPVRLEVDRAFIPLLLRDSLQEQLEYTELLDRAGRRLIILGEPGSGKSSLFKRLFRDACRRAAASPRKAPLPLLYELRNLADQAKEKGELTGERLLDILLVPLRDSAVYDASRGAENLGFGAGFLILLDGLDEVRDTLSTSVVTAIIEMCQSLGRTSPKSTVLLSSRNQYFFARNSRELQEGFDVLSVRPFTLGDIYSFLARWPFKELARQNVTRIFSRLRQLPSLTEMCTNPLALSMFVARDQQTEGTDLPETRSRFYESLLEELIVNRRSRGEGLPAGRQRLRDARRAVLGPVCLEHLLSRDEASNSIPRSRFVAAIEKEKYGGKDAYKALDDLASDTGLFIEERRGETERFMHLTLCEFLAAVEIVETGEAGWERLFSLLGEAERFWESRLAEVVAFACGLAGRSLRQRILSDLAGTDAPQVMLKAIIEAQFYDDTIAVHAIDSEGQYLAGQAPDKWDVEWFSRLRVIVGVLRDAHAGRSKRISDSQVAALSTSSDFLMYLMEKYDAKELLLETLARQDAEAAISIASETGRRDLMDHVASASDDFAVIQGILSKCEAGDGTWRAALCERALLDKNVARILNSVEAGASNAQSPNISNAWQRSSLLGDSAYGSLVDDFLRERQYWSQRMTDFLGMMAKINVPSRRLLAMPRPRSLVYVFPILAGIGLWIFIPTLTTPARSSTASQHNANTDSIFLLTLLPVIAVFSVFISFLLALLRTARKRSQRDTSAASKISAVKIELDDRFKVDLLPKEIMPTGEAYFIKTRANILREILNVSSSVQKLLPQIVPEKSAEIRPEHPLSDLILNGVPPRESRCLVAARLLRQNIARPEVGRADPEQPTL
jgi:hypothetical protein